MKKSNIHPTAVIEPGAIIGDKVTIEPYAIIKAHVKLEEGVTIKSHAYIDGHTIIGAGTTIYPFASIGTQTQDLKYKGETTFVKIGKNCQIREFVTINSSCGENTSVEIGDDCLIMAYCHIAHNCIVGNRVIMSNNATLAGHVIVEDCAIISGFVPVHQFSRIGKYAMVGGMSRITRDVPPYTIGAGIPYKFGGINIVGLKRHGFSLKIRQELGKAFKIVYRSKACLEEALLQIERELEPLPEILHFVEFCRSSKRGLLGLEGITNFDDEVAQAEKEAETELIAKIER
ncbi:MULTISPECIES: acyl-ACP--UDP-N-acetylglucosamine O-acyltransferase [unclassified Neochlamydia]|uniref:acyl-ACP--UDP-N-acetylglucosamine O-acyltransferase n=1 Tax=unclassified Neochlamydia TaxID=2643326 RepID=UPI00140AF942|nr:MULTISPECIES: acyl-ACP--UDP-N-acetylglucosamine O-acyltransferase [unclassified Neochlamydia]MBS4167372.1 Acyl-[acyl-carrier-protein]--UDP-N- acetylglucosamine O-acyltransferase [Neochlamydia sp. AcF65]